MSNLAHWDTEMDTWDDVGGGVYGGVDAIMLVDGGLYVGGSFSMAGGVPASSVFGGLYQDLSRALSTGICPIGRTEIFSSRRYASRPG